MIKSIKLKLWLTFFVSLVFSLGSLLVLTHYSVKQRFLDYATDQILERLEPLEVAVAEVFSKNQSLKPFLQDPEQWEELQNATYRQYMRHQRFRTSTALGPKQQDWSARQSIEKKLQANQRAFFLDLILVDTKKNLVSGILKDNANYAFRQITLDGELIAYIGYNKPKAFLRSVDKLFVDQQLNVFGMLSVVMVFAALVITMFVARWLVTPLSKLSYNAKKLAQGDFSVRMNSTADDELGTLCQNFDEMARTLEKNEITRKQWVADISHEMRTPLSVLKAQIEAMQDGIRAASQENLNLLKRNVDSISLIVDDLYELSLVDVGALTFHKSDTDLSELIREIVGEFEEKMSQKGLNIHCDKVPMSAHYCYVDKKRIKQLVTNLLENSFRYTDAPGDIHLSLKQDAKQYRLTIEDSAPGVPAESLERIFDRLYRLESSRNRETGGAGLGLSICKGIAEGHGGSILAEASSIGGVKQTIFLPKKTL